MLLLDTHAAIWLAEGPSLRASAQRAVRAALEARELLFSAVSAWELGLLVEKKRLAFMIPVETWVDRFVSRPGIRTIPLDISMALRATSLPRPFVQDPADRFLVSTARVLSVPILTRDKRILDYSRAGHVRAIAC